MDIESDNKKVGGKEDDQNKTKQVKNGLFVGLLAVLLLVVVAFVLYAIGKDKPTPQVTVEEPKMSAAETRALLLTPPQPSEIDSYNAFVVENAVDARVLTVGNNCEMSPLVIKISPENDLTIKNTTESIQTIIFEDQDAFSVSPGKERSLNIKETFSKDDGVYRYRCNNSEEKENVGVMYIVQE